MSVICPTGCDYELPEVNFNYCNPDLRFGEIEKVYIANKDCNPFSDWTSPVEWLARISSDGVDDNVIRELHVIGDMPAPEKEEITISLNRKATSPRTFSINVDIDDVSDENYDFMRSAQCNTQYRVWYAAGDSMFGGNEGILATLTLDYAIERGAKSIQKMTGKITWDDKFSPERCTNPLAE